MVRKCIEIPNGPDECSDEELCAQASAGNANAEEILVTRYYALVRACARPLFLTGGDGEDLIQEGMFGLIQAIREYREGKSASFRTFAEVCIRNRLFSALRAAARDKHAPLNQSVSLDHPFFDSNSYTAGAFDVSHTDPELLIADRDYVESVLESTAKQLSEFEARILGYYLDGLSCQEIAKIVGKPPKSVDNAVQRVRRKTAQQLHSGDGSRR
ncbi:MAG: sigma-70 family RNA polymerase sigma factor [Ruminococcaceae bacterium]|nr:sigma-70 family RNA polymerase sigma factor [Oscillospiraceae bacterium]